MTAEIKGWLLSKRVRRAIAYKQDWQCYWCLEPMNEIHNDPREATLEHKIPKHKGGSDRRSNLAACCRQCNTSRHPEIERRPQQASCLVATTGEMPSSPFDILKVLK